MAKQTAVSDERSDVGDFVAGSEGTPESVVGTSAGPESIEDGDAGTGEYSAEQPAEQPKKRRGRRTKAEIEAAGGTHKKKVVSVGAKELATKVKGAHHFLAMFTGIPVIELNDEESEQLASASIAVLSQYDMALSPKAAAWLNLAATLGMIYGVRIYAYRAWSAEQMMLHKRANGEDRPTSIDDINWDSGNAALS